MAQVKLYQIDAFAEQPYTVNPAAIVILDGWIDKKSMQNIALENNLSETAFLVKREEVFEIRYFTPKVEVELCGHATLGSSFVLFELMGYKGETITFKTRKRGNLFVSKKNDKFMLNFPTDILNECTLPEPIVEALAQSPIYWQMGTTDILLEYENEKQIKQLSPNFEMMKKADVRGIIVTAPGNEVDFVSRFFAPHEGINEDPVTGSAHTSLIPFWYKKLRKPKMIAKQLEKQPLSLQC